MPFAPRFPLLVAAFLPCFAACRSATLPSQQEQPVPLATLPDFRIEAVAIDGNRDDRKLDRLALQQIVDSDGLVVLRFDNRALLARLEADLKEGIRHVDQMLAALAREEQALTDPGSDAESILAAAQWSMSARIDPKALDQVLEPLEHHTILVKAYRTTPTNVRSQVFIPEWTEGEAPEMAARGLPARIQRLLDELKSKAEQAKDKDAEQDKQRAGRVDPQALRMETPELAEEKKDKEEKLIDIRRALLGVLPEARLSLARLDLQRGDLLDVFVEFHRSAPAQNTAATPGAAGAPAPPARPDELVDLAEYHLEVDDLGWEPHVRPQLILYRGTSGTSDERDWKMNAAGLVEWSYRYRSPDNCLEDFVNQWEPGLGVHVASLGQGDDTVEVGLGVNASLFRGLLSAGWGANLSEDDHYYFVGGDILKLLDAAKALSK